MTMPHHDEWRDRLTDYALGELTPAESRDLERHLRDCAECAAEARELSHVMEGLALAPQPITPPAHLRQRVMAALAALPRRDVVPHPTALPSTHGWNSGWLAAAATLIVVLGAATLMTQRNAREANRQVRQADAEMTQLREQLATFTGQTELALSILTAPDMQRIELAGNTNSARAYWSQSRGLLVAADSLPVPPPGRVYQVWLIGTDAPLSAGILGAPRSGRGFLVAPPPGGLSGGRVTVAVTDEPPGGLPAPTGGKHLVGSL